MYFEKINKIKIYDESSWREKIFITFDLDWCADEILTYLLDILADYDVLCTLFITHKSPVLNKLIDNTNFELGIHPNFNPLLEGNFKFGNSIEEVIKYYKNIVPESTSIRSHSLTQNSNYLNMLIDYGFKHECNNYIPLNSEIVINPYLHWDKRLIRVPQNIVSAKKQGFSSPDASWFKGESIDFVKNQLFNKNALIYNFVNQSVIESLVQEHLDGKQNRRLLIWSLINFEQYLKS